MNEQTIHTGGCLCGAVRFEATGEPGWTCYCHCHSCRRHTASPVASFVGFTEKTFRYTRGQPKTFESSPQTWRSFCADCGTPLTYHADWDKAGIHVYLGALDNPDTFPPRFHVNCAEKIAWFETTDDLKRHRSMLKG
jgi:hypothetical protein